MQSSPPILNKQTMRRKNSSADVYRTLWSAIWYMDHAVPTTLAVHAWKMVVAPRTFPNPSRKIPLWTQTTTVLPIGEGVLMTEVAKSPAQRLDT